MPIHCFLCHHVGLADACQVFWSLEQDQHVLLAADSTSHSLGCIESHSRRSALPNFPRSSPEAPFLALDEQALCNIQWTQVNSPMDLSQPTACSIPPPDSDSLKRCFAMMALPDSVLLSYTSIQKLSHPTLGELVLARATEGKGSRRQYGRLELSLLKLLFVCVVHFASF